MNFGVLLFADLKTIVGNHSFAPAEPTLWLHILRRKH